MRKINPEHINELLKFVNCSPYFELLTMKVREVGIGFSKIEIEFEKKHCNPFGVVHGGAYSSIIDAAAYWSVYCELDDNIFFTTIDLSVNNLSSIDKGKVIAEGKSIKIGRSICLAEATVKDTHGKLLAYGTSKLIILNAKQSIEDALEAMGSRPLPPKFID